MNSNIQHKAGLFIGIGGSGVKSLARLKANMYQLYKNAGDTRFSEHKFIFIDTDRNDINSLNDNRDLIKKLDENKPIDIKKGEFVDIGRTVPNDVRESLNNFSRDNKVKDHFNSWMITESDNSGFQLLKRTLSSGAAASRIDGRTGFFDNFNDIKQKIHSAIIEIKTLHGTSWEDSKNLTRTGAKETNFWLISGTNGGTGSSMTLDLLFLIDRLFQHETGKGKPQLKLALLTPQPYLDKSADYVVLKTLNSFASLWEINAFKTLKPRFTSPDNNETNYFNYLAATNLFKDVPHNNQHIQWDVFDYCIAFDTKSKDGDVSIELDLTYDNVADTILTLSCLTAGSKIDSNMINTIWDWETEKQGTVTQTPKLIDGVKWGNYVAATSNKTLQKPINHLTNYLRARLKFETLQFGLIGDSFESVIGKNTQMQNEQILKICSEQLLGELFLKNTADSELTVDANNLHTLVKNEFDKISKPEELDIKKNSFLGVSTGFKKGIFEDNWNAIRGEILTKIEAIKKRYTSDSNDPISKNQILKNINENFRSCLDSLVINYGYQFAYDVIYKLDLDLENDEGKKYLGDLNLKNSSEKLDLNYSDVKLSEIESSIETCVQENEDLESLISNIQSYVVFHKERLILQIKKEIIEQLVKGRKGMFDSFLISPNGESGLSPLLEKLKKTLSISKIELDKLAIDFSTEKNPLKVYLPPLDMMIQASKWKQGSDFDKLNNEILPRELNGQASSEYGINPLRRGANSLSDILEKIRTWVISNNKIDYSDGCLYAELAINENLLFDKFINYFFDLNPEKMGWIEKNLIQEHPSVVTWKNKSLDKEFTKIKSENPNYIKDLGLSFSENHVLYPTSRNKEGIETMCIYSGGKDLKEIAYELGFRDDKNFEWRETTDNSVINKIVFEVGHTLGEYRNLSSVYAPFYEMNQNRIQKFEIGCHIHKHFNQLDVNKIMREAVRGFQVNSLSEKVYAIHLTYYSALFDLMKTDEENKDILNLLFKSSVASAFRKTSTVTLPLLWIPDKNNVFYVRKLVLDPASKMLVGNGHETVTVQNARDYGDLMIKSLDHNDRFKSQIDQLSLAFIENKNRIGNRIFDFIQKSHSGITDKAAEISKYNAWESTPDDKSQDLIADHYDEIMNENIFK
jgi:hypothetical protein